jgi:hypothetical protein
MVGRRKPVATASKPDITLYRAENPCRAGAGEHQPTIPLHSSNLPCSSGLHKRLPFKTSIFTHTRFFILFSTLASARRNWHPCASAARALTPDTARFALPNAYSHTSPEAAAQCAPSLFLNPFRVRLPTSCCSFSACRVTCLGRSSSCALGLRPHTHAPTDPCPAFIVAYTQVPPPPTYPCVL